MNIFIMHISLAPLIPLIAGNLILIAPPLFKYIVDVYLIVIDLIVIGVIGLTGGRGYHI